MLQAGWKDDQATWREYVREAKHAREHKQKLLPNPHHNRGAWLQWKQTRDFMDYQGRQPWR